MSEKKGFFHSLTKEKLTETVTSWKVTEERKEFYYYDSETKGSESERRSDGGRTRQGHTDPDSQSRTHDSSASNTLPLMMIQLGGDDNLNLDGSESERRRDGGRTRQGHTDPDSQSRTHDSSASNTLPLMMIQLGGDDNLNLDGSESERRRDGGRTRQGHTDPDSQSRTHDSSASNTLPLMMIQLGGDDNLNLDGSESERRRDGGRTRQGHTDPDSQSRTHDSSASNTLPLMMIQLGGDDNLNLDGSESERRRDGGRTRQGHTDPDSQSRTHDSSASNTLPLMMIQLGGDDNLNLDGSESERRRDGGRTRQGHTDPDSQSRTHDSSASNTLPLMMIQLGGDDNLNLDGSESERRRDGGRTRQGHTDPDSQSRTHDSSASNTLPLMMIQLGGDDNLNLDGSESERRRDGGRTRQGHTDPDSQSRTHGSSASSARPLGRSFAESTFSSLTQKEENKLKNKERHAREEKARAIAKLEKLETKYQALKDGVRAANRQMKAEYTELRTVLNSELALRPTSSSLWNINSTITSLRATTGELLRKKGLAQLAARETNEICVEISSDSAESLTWEEEAFEVPKYSAGWRRRSALVLVSGMGPVGVEIGRNLILSGIKNLTIQDTKKSEWGDLSAQCYLNQSSIGKNRADESSAELEKLDDSVVVQCITQPLTEEIVATYDLVILTETLLSDQLKINGWARKYGKKTIVADARGLFGMIFNDFGDEFDDIFQIFDPLGEPCKEAVIENVDKTTGDVTCSKDAILAFRDGDCVTFSQIKGIPETNTCQPVEIKVTGLFSFNVGDAFERMDGKYDGGGMAKQYLEPTEANFKPLCQAFVDPRIEVCNSRKAGRESQLHILWQSLNRFLENHGRLPRRRNVEDADKVLELAKEVNLGAGKAKVETVEDELGRELSFQARGNLSPVSGFIGGVAAQEAMKAITGIHTPINQWFYFDALECLPSREWSDFSLDTLTEDMCQQKEDRYSGQAAVLGWKFQEEMLKQKWVMVGAGGIGCELLKNFAMMGVCAGKEGKLTVTDMDYIEDSNLNPQFLFRRHGKKSVAAEALRQFNPELKVEAVVEKVGGDMEKIFSDDLDGVAAALDSVDERMSVQRQCLYYQLPLLESGAMGTKGSIQVFYPHLTEPYNGFYASPESETLSPTCTIKNFPSQIEHTVQWAKETFISLFTSPAELANQFLHDPNAFFGRADRMDYSRKMEVFGVVKKALMDDCRPKSSEECVEWARRYWEEYFVNQIRQLLHNFPADQLTAQGAKFWSGRKPCPHPLYFDPANEMHNDFMWSTSLLMAELYGLKMESKEKVMKLVGAIKVPVFTPGVRIPVNESEPSELAREGDEELIRLELDNLCNRKLLNVIDLELEDDTNHHFEFIATCSNLRAEMYGIQKGDMIKTKEIAGRGMTCMAPTTAVVAGLLCLEMYKIMGVKSGKEIPLERFNDGFINMAIPLFGFSQPVPAQISEYNDQKWTLWDRFELEGELSLEQFINWMQAKHSLELKMLSEGRYLLYAFFMPSDKKNRRKMMSIKELVESISRKPLPSHVTALVLEALCKDRKHKDVHVPYIKYKLPFKG